ncbi:non-homologous end-joining DNA ligase [Symbiobacterium terraclitae]|uniref:non-homologous end-joining DNA ligase n=1 Tax=Symbiobacterium terraclitae TaxID=557451 RepID=UPI0035B549AD
MAGGSRQRVSVAGRELVVTNLDKPFWPEDGLTKGDLIAYYVSVAPYLLPYLRGRPVVLTRYPHGYGDKWFYQKDAPEGLPDWIPTWPDQAEDGRVIRYMRIEEPAALAYVANLGAIELHPWLSSCNAPDQPDWAVIDLDPAEGATFQDVLVVARLVGQILGELGLTGYPKLSGATGIHILCRAEPGTTYAETATFCELMGRLLLRAYPEKVTLERAVAKRAGKVYVDYLQNRRGQTITSVYGVRPLPGAPVSAPVTWAEVAGEPPRFTIRTLPDRLAAVGDLFAPMVNAPQDLRGAIERLKRIV